MRSWLEDFLREPHVLPPDPGPGDERVSLTLPQAVVEVVSSRLRCSTSAALRRIAVERLEAEIRYEEADGDGPDRQMIDVRSEPQDASSQAGAIAGLVIHVILAFLFVGVCLFIKSRKKKTQDV
jgi:hypothetical protein